MAKDIVERAVAKAGGTKAALARRLGIFPQAISQWSEVPHKHVLAIADLVGVDPREVRADSKRGHPNDH